MQLSVGLDSVEIVRFIEWSKYTHSKLTRIFSEQEITYCLSVPQKSAERFAVRFAAREAFFKAIIFIEYTKNMPFLTLCKHVQVKSKGNGAPFIVFDPDFLGLPKETQAAISLTHTQTTATAIVILTINSGI